MKNCNKTKVNVKALGSFHVAYKKYKASYASFVKLDSETRNSITDNLIEIESNSSVKIEQPEY